MSWILTQRAYTQGLCGPLWPHRQSVGLAFPMSRVRVPEAAASLVICGPHLHRAIRGPQGVLNRVGGGVTASQLDLPFLTPLSFAGYGRLQLGALIGLLQ